MESSQLVWTIVIIIAVLLILGLVFFFARRLKQTRDREQAENLRQAAAADEFSAREGEAQAARAAAEAQQAEVDAARLREEARVQTEESQAARDRAREQALKAESLDPDTDTSGHQPTAASDAGQDPSIDSNQPEQERQTGDRSGKSEDGTTGP